MEIAQRAWSVVWALVCTDRAWICHRSSIISVCAVGCGSDIGHPLSVCSQWGKALNAVGFVNMHMPGAALTSEPIISTDTVRMSLGAGPAATDSVGKHR